MPWELVNPKPKPPKVKYIRPERISKADQKYCKMMSLMVPPATNVETIFRHSHWKERRQKVRAALMSVCTGDFAMNRFDECGSECAVEYNPVLKKHRVRGNYCKCRHCEPCMRARGNKMARNLRTRLDIQANGRYRFITLTLKHNDKPLREQITRIYASFKALRATKWWKSSQRGGATVLEVKRNAKSNAWHVHLHIVAEGDFIHKDDLSNAWHQVTGDSFITDIRRLDSGKDAAHYVCKYVSKGTSGDVWETPDLAAEWITATKGVRVCATFGTWRGYALMAKPAEEEGWVKVCSLNDLVHSVQRGEAWAEAALLSLRPPGASDDSCGRSDGS